jgi:hydrogenase maturation factor HypF (carbamoyltransferase family)
MAVSYLAHHFGREFLKTQLPFLKGIPNPRLQLVLDVIERRVNLPLTSSCGRLFDAVAALAGIRWNVNYEAQAAIELEMVAEGSNSSRARTHLTCWRMAIDGLSERTVCLKRCSKMFYRESQHLKSAVDFKMD